MAQDAASANHRSQPFADVESMEWWWIVIAPCSDYRPLISNYLVGTTLRIHYIASFIVRDDRDFSQMYNPTTTPATQRSTCDKYGP